MSARMPAIAVAFVALATLPIWMPGIYYINVASQILFYAVFALGLMCWWAMPGWYRWATPACSVLLPTPSATYCSWASATRSQSSPHW